MVKNKAESVKQRLLNYARQNGQVYNNVLITYGLQRLIYRLSISKHENDYILKGGMLVTQWTVDNVRPTKDLDFLGFGDDDADRIVAVFTEIMNIEGEDGLVFDTENLTATPIRDDQNYGGIRLKTKAYLDKTEIVITIDIGFGDAITDPEYRIEYPSVLDFPAVKLRAYPPESVIAEKFQAVVALGLINGRMKDYYDLWNIPNAIPINEAKLDNAIRATFERRGTDIPLERPPGMSVEFIEDEQKVRQWAAYSESVNLEGVSLREVIENSWAYIDLSCGRIRKASEKN